ncbi:conserved protein of unknown function (plasmid) [Thermococcus nautili]|uniref:zinc dependent phospholipase C family protein n=1 Tax=Thermococcus nautili TaxID=195522 RepID=UPI002556CC11|nr:hypothetical protein [Thermococcus nautili]CAI1494237.1 conserved protein of unknown function [Thermococcus nautili]
MKWREHKRITKYIAKTLGVSNELANKLAESSILPDITPDFGLNVKVTKRGNLNVRESRIQHHSETAKTWAWKYLYKARRQYLTGDPRWVESLGRAVHYIQDYTVSKHHTVLKFIKLKSWETHDEIENGLSKVPIPREEIVKASKVPVSANIIKEELQKLTPKENVEEVMREATYMTTLAMKSVLRPTKPKDLERNFNRALKRHLFLVGFPIAGAVASYIFGHEAYSIILLGVSALFHVLDFNFHKWNLERRWFYP